jgi:membrane protein implicated in regulation of membrane protease activity
MTEALVNIIASLTFGHFLSLSIFIVILDALILGGLFLFPLAFASFLSGIFSLTPLSSTLQLWAIPFNVALGLIFQIRILKNKRFRLSPLPNEISDSLIGAIGHITKIEIPEESNSYFYSYKEHINHEAVPNTKAQSVCKVRLADGTLRPLVKGDKEFHDGATVRVVGIEGYALKVQIIDEV